MPGSNAKHSDLRGLGWILDSAVFRGFLGDCNMQQSLRATAPATCCGFALCSFYILNWLALHNGS